MMTGIRRTGLRVQALSSLDDFKSRKVMQVELPRVNAVFKRQAGRVL